MNELGDLFAQDDEAPTPNVGTAPAVPGAASLLPAAVPVVQPLVATPSLFGAPVAGGPPPPLQPVLGMSLGGVASSLAGVAGVPGLPGGVKLEGGIRAAALQPPGTSAMVRCRSAAAKPVLLRLCWPLTPPAWGAPMRASPRLPRLTSHPIHFLSHFNHNS